MRLHICVRVNVGLILHRFGDTTSCGQFPRFAILVWYSTPNCNSAHVSAVSSVDVCFQLRRIKSCVKALPSDAAKAVVNSFVVYKIDYCNCLLIGAKQYQLDRLQAVLNAAARLLFGVGKFDRIRHIIRDAFIGFLFHVAFSSKSVC